MLTKIAPSGLGLWVAFEGAIDPGPKSRDIAVAIDGCRRARAPWIAPRAGAGGANDAAFDEVSASAYLGAGLGLYPWIFPYPNTDAKVVAGFRRFFDAGAHGCILNAEFEYQPASASQARNLVKLIRDAWAEAQGERLRTGKDVIADEPWIAHAPPDYLGAGVDHALSDELVALDEVCDAILPQVYAFEHSDHGHVHHLERVAEGYRRRGIDFAKLLWIGCTYRPRERGGKKLLPLPNQPQRIADDIIAFLNHELVMRCSAPSLYSFDATRWVDPRDGEAVMAALEGWAGRDTDPSEAPTTPGTPRSKSSQRMQAVDAPIAVEPGLQLGDERRTEWSHKIDRPSEE